MISLCARWQVVELDEAGALSARLVGDAESSHAQLDGFKSRALRTEVPEQRLQYALAWRALGMCCAQCDATLLVGAAIFPNEDKHPSSWEKSIEMVSQAGGGAWTGVAVTLALGPLGLFELEMALVLVQTQAAAEPPPLMWLLSTVGQWQAEPWGLARSARAEALLPLQCFNGVSAAPLLHGTTLAEPEAMVDCGTTLVPRLMRPPPAWVSILPTADSQLVTGGTGGLGLLTARWLVQRCGAHALVLASRSGVLAHALVNGSSFEWEQVRAISVAVLVQRCDTTEGTHVARLVAHCAGARGIWHAAGMLADSVLPSQTPEALARVCAPKAFGARAMQRACASVALRTCAMFSSVAALLGGAGQANYSAANASLDALASCGRERARAVTSVQWGAWAEVGMAARGKAAERMAAMEVASGFGRLALAQGLGALHAAALPCAPSNASVMMVQWQRLGRVGTVPALLTDMVAPILALRTSAAAVEQRAARTISLDAVLEMVRRMAGGAVDADVPLMEAGIDSLGASELRNQLQRTVGDGVVLSSTLMFDYPTARQVANHMKGNHSIAADIGRSQVALASAGEEVEVTGLSAILPWGVSELREMSHCGRDLLCVIPLTRWDVEQAALDLVGSPPEVASRVRHGGFLRDAELFEHNFFGISGVEAEAMDPQQRQLIGRAYSSLHAAGLPKPALLGAIVGVYVGQWQSEFGSVLLGTPAGHSVYASTGFSCSVTCGRVSFVLGLHGPCASYDTACSASLVALHGGVRALQRLECESALSAGVNMILDPGTMLGTAIGGFTSVRGRSHTFDARADGYARGEAIDALACQLSNGALGTQVLGIAIRQDGRSASLTAPSGQAQCGLLGAALGDGSLASERVAMLEAHGTGTALGDPIEARSMAASFLSQRIGSDAFVVGSLKANTGHTEPGAGVAGSLKLLAQLYGAVVATNAQLRALNTHVGGALYGHAPCALPLQGGAVSKQVGGVSSFGYAGTIVHAALSFAANSFVSFSADVGQQWKQRHRSASAPPLYSRRAFPWLHVMTSVDSARIHMYAVCWLPVSSSSARAPAGRVLLLSSVTLHSRSRGHLTSQRPSIAHAAALSCQHQLNELCTRISSSGGLTPLEARIVTAEDIISRQISSGRATVVLNLTDSTSSLPSLYGTRLALELVQPHAAHMQLQSIHILTSDVYAVDTVTKTAHGGAWGLARVVRLENAALRVQSIDVASCGLSAAMRLTVGETIVEKEVTWRGAQRSSTRLHTCSASATRGEVLGNGLYAITGGLGGLGVHAARLLVKRGASEVLLLSRRGHAICDEPGLERLVRSMHAAVVIACDAADAQDVSALFASRSLEGVLHAAGVLRDSLLQSMVQSDIYASAVPKAFAASHLQIAVHCKPLEAFGLFSSLASLFGNVGQANYAAANAFLDVLALCCRSHGCFGSSLQIPAVSGAGMGARRFAAEKLDAMGAISLDTFVDCLSVSLVPARAATERTQAPLSPMALENIAAPSLQKHGQCERDTVIACTNDNAEGSAFAQAIAPCAPNEKRAMAAVAVLRVVLELTGVSPKALTADTPLMEAGVDSLAATELASRLRALAGVALSSTLVFEQPTAHAISALLVDQGGAHAESAPSFTVPTSRAKSLGGIVCMDRVASRWPGGLAARAKIDVALSAAGDAITLAPATRWSHDGASLGSVLQGGFLSSLERFDAASFGLAPAEALAMDPQQRLLLEIGYAALHRSSQRRASLMSVGCGVFVGIEHLDWQLLQALQTSRTALQRSETYAASGEQAHVASARLAFALDVHGPSTSINTACSSALVAVHSAVTSVRTTECISSLTAGVKVMLIPFGIDGRILARDGRSKSFDARADGYGRSEAVAAVQLDMGGRKIGLVGGSGVQSGGRAASLTAPNGSAQKALIQVVLARASLSPAEVTCIQPQGNGSALADPIEMRAVTVSLGTDRATVLTVGCHKANAGHSEAPSGMLGLLIAQTVASSAKVSPNAQLRALSPLVAESVAPATPPLALGTNGLVMTRAQMAVGITAFGVSGIVAHVIAQAHPGSGKRSAPVEMQSDLKLARRGFPWQEPPHPFAKRRVQSPDGTVLIRSACNEGLGALVADHVVQGSVIFPGVGYMVLVHAARQLLTSTAKITRLLDVFFLQPLATEAAGLHVECAISEARFEVCSGEVGSDGSLVSVGTHCSGLIGQSANATWQRLDHALLRSRCCARLSESASLYQGLHAVGLQYGPGYRTLVQLWGGESGVGLARLRARGRYRDVHPADLDDALCVIALASRNDGGGATRLPFAVADALLEGIDGELWASASQQLHEGAVVRLSTSRGESQAQLDGFKSRELRGERLASPQAMLRVHVTRPGSLSGLVLAAQPAFEADLAPTSVELQVQAVGLNFRDVLLVLGEYPGPFEPPGRCAHTCVPSCWTAP